MIIKNHLISFCEVFFIVSRSKNDKENIGVAFDRGKIKIMNDEIESLINKKYQLEDNMNVLLKEIHSLEQHIEFIKSMHYRFEFINNSGIHEYILLIVICTITVALLINIFYIGLIMLTIELFVVFSYSFIKVKYKKMDELRKSKNNEYNFLLKELDNVNYIIGEIKNTNTVI